MTPPSVPLRLAITGAIALCAALAGDPAADFDAGLARCRSLLDRAKWAEARDAIVLLAEEHDGTPHAAARRGDVLEILERAEFRAGWTAPELATLVSGKIVSYNASSKRIKLVYERGSLADFERAVQKDAKTGAERTVLRHPVRFTGPYTIEVTASLENWILSEFGILFNIDGDRYYLAAFLPLALQKSLLVRIDEKGQEDFGEIFGALPTPRHPTRVAVGRNRLEFSTAGGKPKAVSLPFEPGGGFGILTDGDFVTRIVVEGPIDPSWLRGLADAAETRAFAEWRKSFDPTPLLPASFAPAPDDSGRIVLPDLLTKEASARLDPVLALTHSGKHTDALAALDALPKDAIPPATRDFVGASAEAGRGEWARALDRVERLLEIAPDYLPARRLRARALEGLGRSVASAREYETILADFPAAPDGYAGLAIARLGAGRVGDAERLLADAAAKAVRSKEIDEVAELLRKAREGPKWPTSAEYSTPHYVVRTDLGRETAARAARLLEEARRAYSTRLERPDADEGQGPSRVFLFSSEASYVSYAESIGSRRENTAGIYNPALRQLLVWNQPNEENFERTIRHEGFHQYFHRIAEHRPVWLDEGLAEYFESAGADATGAWKEGRPIRAHVTVLKRESSRLLPLASFLRVRRDAFYASPDESYAQAWAFAHFLRQDAGPGKRFFDAVFSKLVAGETEDEALSAGYEAVTPIALSRAYAAHLVRLLD